VTPTELARALDVLGVKVTERTLLNWVKAGVLPDPERSNMGRSKGKIVEYSSDAAYFGYAAWRLRADAGLRLPEIAHIKKDVVDWWAAESSGRPLPQSVYFTPEHFAWIVFFRLASRGVSAAVPVVMKNWEQSGMVSIYPRSAMIPGEQHVEAGILPTRGLEAKTITLIADDGLAQQIYPYE
jgi:hypothetical protein